MAANASSVGGNNDPNAPGGSSISNALADPHAKVRALEQIAKDLKFDSVSQMCIAWSVKNQTSVTCVSSAATLEQFEEIIASLAVSGRRRIKHVIFNLHFI
jgi:aryl-alcohol dehydrogenase-like predicted oxidoreductase